VPDWNIQIVGLAEQGDDVFVQWHMTGTHFCSRRERKAGHERWIPTHPEAGYEAAASAALRGWRDVLIHAEEVPGVVLLLDLREPLVVLPVGGPDAILALALAQEVDVGAAGREGV